MLFFKNRRNVLLLAVICLILLLFSLPTFAETSEGNSELLSEELDEFIKVYNDILENYAEDITPEKLEVKAIKGMLEELDPYSRYFTADEYEDFQDNTEGTFGGIGVRIEKKGDYVQVIAPLPDTPGEKAGLKSGDKVLKVGLTDVKGFTLKKVADLIKGEPGTSVVLTIGREDPNSPIIFTITRELIKLDVVESELLEENMGYIRLKTFSDYSAREFNKAINNLKNEGAEGFIVDLRNNPGGYLGSALSVASKFVDEKDELVHVVNKGEDINTYWSTSNSLNMPLVVLINKGSASGSEIVAGTVKDHGVGILVGTESYGKASVQTLKELRDGNAYKLTTAKYLTPNKIDINQKGITPDYYIEDTNEQLEKAQEILRDEMNSQKLNIIFTPGKKEVVVNNLVKKSSAAPYLKNNNIMVPLRFISNQLEGKISWDADSKNIIFAFNDKEIIFKIKSSEAFINCKKISLQTPVEVKKGLTFIPLNFLKYLDYSEVTWDKENKQAVINMRK
jgi:carboxyl-terminal processing protease